MFPAMYEGGTPNLLAEQTICTLLQERALLQFARKTRPPFLFKCSRATQIAFILSRKRALPIEYKSSIQKWCELYNTTVKSKSNARAHKGYED